MKMNKIRFDLNKYNLTEQDFNVLIHRHITNGIVVNGYMVKWDYTIQEGIVELTAWIEER